MLDGSLLELTDDGQVHRRRFDSDVAALHRARGGSGWLLATRHHLLLADSDELHAPVRQVARLWGERAGVRSNEGGCAPDGTLYLGSMADDATPRMGQVVRIPPDATITEAIASTTISNGIVWSPDGARAYFADTVLDRLDLFDWSPSDGLHARRPWVQVESPDGIAADAEGGIWVARFGHGLVERYAPDGSLSEVIEVPARQVTAVAFAGDGRRLVITTSRYGIETSAEPGAGALFAVADAGVEGLPLHEFAG